jgi:hypothetical protein
LGDNSELLGIESVCSTEEDRPHGIRISLESKIFDVEGFPIEIRSGENPVEIAEKQIKAKDR